MPIALAVKVPVFCAAMSQDMIPSVTTSPASNATPPELERSRRLRDVVAIIGTPNGNEPKFTPVLNGLVDYGWHTHVVPVLRARWPEVFTLPFLHKLREGFHTYAPLGLSAIVCSRTRPLLLRAACTVFRQVRMTDARMAALGMAVMPWWYRVALHREMRGVALMSALILLLDEALDDNMGSVPLRDRPRELRRVMDGERRHLTGVLAAVDGVCSAVRAECQNEKDREALKQVFDATSQWAEGEVANLAGERDPTGMCHRRIGITASMDLVAWGIRPFMGELERDWMYLIAELGQMVDDWVDVEKDASNGRVTPVMTGKWTLEGIATCWVTSQRMLLTMAAEGGERYAPYIELIRRTFVTQIQRMVQILIDNP